MKFTPFPILLTARLRLRSMGREDREVVFFLRSAPEVNQFIKRAPCSSLGEAEQFIDRINEFVAQGESINWSITLRGDDSMIGSICLWNFSDDGSVAEVGYDLLPAFQHQGIMQEALEAVLNFGFSQLQLADIEAFTHSQNDASKKLLERNGFLLQNNRKDEEYPDNVVFSLTKSFSE